MMDVDEIELDGVILYEAGVSGLHGSYDVLVNSRRLNCD